MSVIDPSSATLTRKDLAFLQRKKERRDPIVMLTCYDYPTALIEEQAGIDVIFVGDSVGTNVLGYTSETEVTMGDMLHHLRAVRRGVRAAYLLVDMPYGSFQTPWLAVENARSFLAEGADGVKLEGGVEQADVVRALTEAGVEVCGHIGFTPQTLGSKGRVQGKSFDGAKVLIESALALEAAGASMVVLELVTEDVARLLTERLRIPTIGIGSGRFCDGQVLVVTDVLGISPFTRRIAKRYQEYQESTLGAIAAYRHDVVSREFPGETNAFSTDPEELGRLRAWLDEGNDAP